jgi:hypothetical protein
MLYGSMPPSSPADDDLLRPTLAAEDDPVRMRGAWNPWTLAALALCGGPLTAGVLFGENFRRLGKQEYLVPVLGAALILAAAAGYAARELRELQILTQEDDTLLLKLLTMAAGLLLTAPIAVLQARRFRIFTGFGGEPGRLWIYGLGALVVGRAGTFLAYQVLKWTS